MLTESNYTLPFSLGDEVFGEYKIRDLLGQGPLGVVYQVTDPRGDLYALKVIHSRWREEMNLEEARSIYETFNALDGRVALGLPIQLLAESKSESNSESNSESRPEDASGDTLGHIALRSPLLEGLTVRKLMSLRKNNSRAFRIDELSQIMGGVCSALDHIHSAALAHGGLKPENLFVSADEQQQRITLSDSRLAMSVGVSAYYKAQRASGLGHYVAPELERGELSPASDIYSLGAFVFEGLTGHAYDDKKSIRDLIPVAGLEPLESLLAKALHEDPSVRHSHAQALLEEFNAVAEYLASLEGSPFVNEGTQPRNESVVARFSVGGGSLNTSDPLLGRNNANTVATPPPLPPNSSVIGLATPPPLPISPQVTLTPNVSSSDRPPIRHEALQQLQQPVNAHLSHGEPSLDIVPIPHTPIPDVVEAQTPAPKAQTPAPREAFTPHTTQAPQLHPRPTVVSNSVKESRFSALLGAAIASVVISAALGVYVLLERSDNPEGHLKRPGVAVSVVEDNKSTAAKTAAEKATAEQVTTANTAAEQAAAEQAAAEKAAAEKAAAEQAAAEKAAAEKAAAEKAAAEKAAAEKAAAEKVAAEKAAAEKAAAEKAAAEKAAAEKAAAEKAAAEKATRASAQRISRADRAAAERAAAKAAAERAAERAAVKAAAEKAAAEKAAAEKAAAEKAAAEKAAQEKAAQEKRRTSNTQKLKTNTQRREPSAPAESRVPSKVNINTEAKELSCPRGMILKTTTKFPRRSIRRGKIRGKRAIALARSGKAYCIDAYEYPGRGSIPKVNVTFRGAQTLCAQANKRLCTDREWVRACKGRRGAAYPYGRKFNPNKCVTEDAAEEERRISRSGSMRGCKSASGAYDMSGNVGEWTSSQRVRGGYYASYDDEATCNSGGRRAPSTKRPYIGFRCCADFK